MFCVQLEPRLTKRETIAHVQRQIALKIAFNFIVLRLLMFCIDFKILNRTKAFHKVSNLYSVQTVIF